MEGPFEAFEDAFAAFAGSDEAVDAFHVSEDFADGIGRDTSHSAAQAVTWRGRSNDRRRQKCLRVEYPIAGRARQGRAFGEVRVDRRP